MATVKWTERDSLTTSTSRRSSSNHSSSYDPTTQLVTPEFELDSMAGLVLSSQERQSHRSRNSGHNDADVDADADTDTVTDGTEAGAETRSDIEGAEHVPHPDGGTRSGGVGAVVGNANELGVVPAFTFGTCPPLTLSSTPTAELGPFEYPISNASSPTVTSPPSPTFPAAFSSVNQTYPLAYTPILARRGSIALGHIPRLARALAGGPGVPGIPFIARPPSLAPSSPVLSGAGAVSPSRRAPSPTNLAERRPSHPTHGSKHATIGNGVVRRSSSSSTRRPSIAHSVTIPIAAGTPATSVLPIHPSESSTPPFSPILGSNVSRYTLAPAPPRLGNPIAFAHSPIPAPIPPSLLARRGSLPAATALLGLPPPPGGWATAALGAPSAYGGNGFMGLGHAHGHPHAHAHAHAAQLRHARRRSSANKDPSIPVSTSSATSASVWAGSSGGSGSGSSPDEPSEDKRIASVSAPVRPPSRSQQRVTPRKTLETIHSEEKHD